MKGSQQLGCKKKKKKNKKKNNGTINTSNNNNSDPNKKRDKSKLCKLCDDPHLMINLLKLAEVK